MFEHPQDEDAWRAAIKMQEEKNTTTSLDTGLVALALPGLKIGHDIVRITDDKSEDMITKKDPFATSTFRGII